MLLRKYLSLNVFSDRSVNKKLLSYMCALFAVTRIEKEAEIRFGML